MNDQAELIAILKAPDELIRFLPIRVVLRKGEDGTLRGFVLDEPFFNKCPHLVEWYSVF